MEKNEVVIRDNVAGKCLRIPVELSPEEKAALERIGERVRARTDWDLTFTVVRCP